MIQPKKAATADGNAEFELQVERVLQSETFRTSDVLRRLLRFLADKAACGEGDQLKEYSVATDGLGKPASYDPQQTTVRIQLGRLRHKLAEYYQTEGKDDALILELPKGGFKLTCEPRPLPVSPIISVEPENMKRTRGRDKRILPLSVALILSLIWGGVVSVRYWRTEQSTEVFRAMWTPEINQLWQPFLNSKRPIVLSIANPPFVEFKGFGVYHERTFSRWSEISTSPVVATIQKALGNAPIGQSTYYTPGGEVDATFLIGKLLGPRVPALSLQRLSDLSWRQLADNNVIYVGSPLFFDQLKSLPVQLQFIPGLTGSTHSVHPAPGEPADFVDKLEGQAMADDGEYFSTITRVPGPLGSSEVVSFTASRTAARLAAVQWFTSETYARILVDKMATPTREIPRYYQVMLRVKFKNGVPTETTYLLHHELHPTAPVNKQ